MASSDALMQLSGFFARKALGLAPPGSAQSQGAAANLEAAQGAIQAEAMRKQKEREEKQAKSEKLGGLGGTLGSIAGIAAAPFTGGASLAATAGLGALGGAAGSAAGQGLSGGKINWGDVGMSGAIGGVSGLAAGMVPKVEAFLAKDAVAAPATGSAMSGAAQAPAGGSAIGATNAAKAGYANPFQASMHGAVPPSHALGAGMPATGQGLNLAKAAQGANMAWQHPGQAIAGQLVNYAKAQPFLGAMGLGGMTGFNRQERFNPAVPSGIWYMRHTDGTYEEF